MPLATCRAGVISEGVQRQLSAGVRKDKGHEACAVRC